MICSFKKSRALVGFVALVAGVVGCTTTTQDNFVNPPAGPPTSCLGVPAIAGCVAGSLSFSCAGDTDGGTDRPDDGDTSLVCDDGTPGVGGATLFCCAPYGQWATECVPNAHVPGCGAQSIGFACSGESSPDEVDTSLVCSQAIAASSGARDYCCVSADQTSPVCRCSSFDDTSGLCGAGTTTCGGAAIGLTCVGAHTPTELNPRLTCDAPDGGAAGTFCCQTP